MVHVTVSRHGPVRYRGEELGIVVSGNYCLEETERTCVEFSGNARKDKYV